MKFTYTFLFGLLALAAAQDDEYEYDPEDDPYAGRPGGVSQQPGPYQPGFRGQGPPPGFPQGPPPGYPQNTPPGYPQGPPPPGWQQGPPPFQQGPPPQQPYGQGQPPFQPGPPPPGPPGPPPNQSQPPYPQGPSPPQPFPPQGGQGSYSRACGYNCIQSVIQKAGCSRPAAGPEFQQAATQCFCTARGMQDAINGCGRQACQQEGRGRSIAELANQFNQMCGGVPGFFSLNP